MMLFLGGMFLTFLCDFKSAAVVWVSRVLALIQKTEGSVALGICTAERGKSRKINVLSGWINKAGQ